MRREGIDAAVDFEFFARSSAILSYLSGARMRVGYHAFHGEASYRGDLMTHRLSFNPLLHASQMFDILVRTLGEPPDRLPATEIEPPAITDGPMPAYHNHPDRLKEVRAILREALGLEEIPPIVLLNANCSDLLPLRRWPTRRYAELTRRLLEHDPELAVVFTGAPDEAPDAMALVDAVGSKRCVSLAGRTTMEQLIALYELSDLMVTNDSGPAQYATLTSIDVITIFGPETPAVFGARSPRSHILWAGLACSPCVNAFNDRQSACRDNLCMQRISVDQVFEAAREVLARRRTEQAQA
jgi:ADP-heptose:LPS heptosyltransferase